MTGAAASPTRPPASPSGQGTRSRTSSRPSCASGSSSDEIEPGGRINVRQLEQHFGVSHIPIREAIRRLEAEGLVVNVPRRGAIAAGVSLNELDEIYDLRRIIEPPVAAPRRRRDGRRRSRRPSTAAYDTLDRRRAGAGAVDFSTAHWDFHWQVLRPGCTDEIERLLAEAVAESPTATSA